MNKKLQKLLVVIAASFVSFLASSAYCQTAPVAAPSAAAAPTIVITPKTVAAPPVPALAQAPGTAPAPTVVTTPSVAPAPRVNTATTTIATTPKAVTTPTVVAAPKPVIASTTTPVSSNAPTTNATAPAKVKHSHRVFRAKEMKPQMDGSNGTKTLAILKPKPVVEPVPVAKQTPTNFPSETKAFASQQVTSQQRVVAENRKSETRTTELSHQKSDSSPVKFYAGVNGNWSHIKHQYRYLPDPSYKYNYNKVDSDAIGFGFEIGARKNFGKTFTGLEVFYDQLNNKSKSPFNSSDQHDIVAQDNTHISNRYGFKTNVGYAITDKMEGFLIAGLANIKYRHDFYSYGHNYFNPHQAKPKLMVPLWGAGFNYNLNKNWSAKVSCDYQKMKTQYLSDPGEKIITKITTLNSGLAYTF